MKTTTILSIVAIVAAVAAAGLVTTVSFSTAAHAEDLSSDKIVWVQYSSDATILQFACYYYVI